MCSRPYRPLGLPIYVARGPAAPFSLLPSSLYLLCRASHALHSSFLLLPFYFNSSLDELTYSLPLISALRLDPIYVARIPAAPFAVADDSTNHAATASLI